MARKCPQWREGYVTLPFRDPPPSRKSSKRVSRHAVSTLNALLLRFSQPPSFFAPVSSENRRSLCILGVWAADESSYRQSLITKEARHDYLER